MVDMSMIQISLLLLIVALTAIVSAETEQYKKEHSRFKKRPTTRRIRGRQLALPLDTELDDDWDWAIRAPKDDPDIHNPGKSGKAGKAGNSGKSPILVETQSPSETQNEEDGYDDGSTSNKGDDNDNTTPSKGKGEEDESIDDDLTSSYSMPSESPSARPSQVPGLSPSQQLIGIIPSPPTETQSQGTSDDPKDPKFPLPSDLESSVSNNAIDDPSGTNAGMKIGVSISSVGLVAVAMLLFRRHKKRKRLVLSASQVVDDNMEQERGGKRRKIVKDGVVDEDDNNDDEMGQTEALVVPLTSRQAPTTPGPLSPLSRTSKARDRVVDKEDENDDEEGGAFTGVYKLKEHYNLTGFLEATGVPWAIRSAAARARPVHFITHEGNVVTMKFKGVPRATYVLDGPAVENVLRDRTFACKATYTVDSLGFEVQQQGVDGGDYDLQLRWTLSDDDMTVTLTMTAVFKPNPNKNKMREPVMCTQIYSRIGEF